MTVFLCLLFSLMFVSCGTKESVDPPKTEDEVIKSVIEPTVMITVGEYRATGVMISKDENRLLIASVAHLLEGFDQGIIRFYSGQAGFADVIYCDEASDVAILEIRMEDMDSEFAASLKTAAIDKEKYEALEQGDTVYLVGSQVSVAGNVMKGTFQAKDYYVPEFDQYLMYLFCDVFEGMSGSGVYDSQGYLVGLITGGTDTGEAVGIPINDYLERME